MTPILVFLMILACFLVLLSLISGLVIMIKGGAVNEKYGNKLMQARVMMQGVALLLFAFIYLSAK
ncbi:MAG: twin transmembrane helix small protein [Pseudomonadota bacterium]